MKKAFESTEMEASAGLQKNNYFLWPALNICEEKMFEEFFFFSNAFSSNDSVLPRS